MRNVEDTAKYWRLHDVWPLPVFLGLLPMLLGVAGLVDSINKREWFWALLGVVLVAGGTYVMAKVLITLRRQRTPTGSAAGRTWPRDAVLRVRDAIRHDRDIEGADADVARRYVARASWPARKVVFFGVLIMICGGIPLASVVSDSVHLQSGSIVFELLGCALGLSSLVRQYRLRRWVRRHPITAPERSIG